MESGLSACIYLCLAFVMLSMMASHIHCVCVAEERKALLQIKAALPELSNGVRGPLLYVCEEKFQKESEENYSVFDEKGTF
ncbi:hypothetical protein Hanom_Chr07g00613031 [Helianthus anomalus]